VAGPEVQSRQELYSGCRRQRLWRGLAAAAALTLALGAGGCSISSPAFDSVFGSSANAEQTGSISPPPGTRQAGELPPDGDLVYARAAISEVLRRDVKYASQPWENPATGARGTVTPVASAYTQDGQTCRDFLASYISAKSQSWLQGEACKQQKGAWEVRSIKPWKRS
jgi:surface antigen